MVSRTRSSRPGPPSRKREQTAAYARREPDNELIRKILHDRARTLAKPIEEVVEKVTISIVPLRIGEEKFAIETRYVLEVLAAPPIVTIPRTGSQLQGLCLIRGKLLPVFDLLSLLELEKGGAEGRSLLAMLGQDKPEFAVSLEEVHPSRSISLDQVRELQFGDAESAAFAQGIMDDGMTLLDGDRLLNHPSLFL